MPYATASLSRLPVYRTHMMTKLLDPAGADSPLPFGGTVMKRLSPGSPGTRRWLERYGKALICVRYRQDDTLMRRYTTVEIVVDERSYRQADALVRIAYDETGLRRKARELGGQWIANRKLWRLSRTAIRTLKLEDRIVENCQ